MYMVQHQQLCHSLKDYRGNVLYVVRQVAAQLNIIFLCTGDATCTWLKIGFFAAIEATTISIQSRCLLDDIRHFYSDFTVYATPYLAHGTHIRGITELRQCHGGLRTIIH